MAKFCIFSIERILSISPTKKMLVYGLKSLKYEVFWVLYTDEVIPVDTGKLIRLLAERIASRIDSTVLM